MGKKDVKKKRLKQGKKMPEMVYSLQASRVETVQYLINGTVYTVMTLVVSANLVLTTNER
jgi:GMP synthase PP-ATPase subunit